MVNDPPTARRQAWLRRPTIIVAWAVLLIALIHPPDGLGIPICLTEATTGLPCPGCGLTRSMSCAVRGMFSASWHYHPFGIAFLVIFAGAAAISVMPAGIRQRVNAAAHRHAIAMNITYSLFIAGFLGFGVTRAVMHHLRG